MPAAWRTALALLLPLAPLERHMAVRRLAWAMRYAALEHGEEGILIDALHLVEQQEKLSDGATGIHYIAEFPPALFILAQPLAGMGRFDEAWRLACLYDMKGGGRPRSPTSR